jgi:hypothetical protein
MLMVRHSLAFLPVGLAHAAHPAAADGFFAQEAGLIG